MGHQGIHQNQPINHRSREHRKHGAAHSGRWRYIGMVYARRSLIARRPVAGVVGALYSQQQEGSIMKCLYYTIIMSKWARAICAKHNPIKTAKAMPTTGTVQH